MVPEAHELSFPVSTELGEHMRSAEFKTDILDKLRDQHVVEGSPQGSANRDHRWQGATNRNATPQLHS